MTRDGRLLALVFSNGSLVVVDLDGPGARGHSRPAVTTRAAGSRRTPPCWWPCGTTQVSARAHPHPQGGTERYAPDGVFGWVCSDDASLTAWTPGGTERYVLDGVFGWTLSPDASRLVTAEQRPSGGGLILRDAQTGEKVLAFEDLPWRRWGILCVFTRRYTGGRREPVSGTGGQAVGQRHRQTHLPLDGHRAPITHTAFSPDGSRVVTASEDGTLLAFDSADDVGGRGSSATPTRSAHRLLARQLAHRVGERRW